MKYSSITREDMVLILQILGTTKALFCLVTGLSEHTFKTNKYPYMFKALVYLLLKDKKNYRHLLRRVPKNILFTTSEGTRINQKKLLAHFSKDSVSSNSSTDTSTQIKENIQLPVL